MNRHAKKGRDGVPANSEGKVVDTLMRQLKAKDVSGAPSGTSPHALSLDHNGHRV